MTSMELQHLLLVVCCLWYHYHVTIPAVTYTHPWVVCLSVCLPACLPAFFSAGNQIQLGQVLFLGAALKPFSCISQSRARLTFSIMLP